MRIVIKNIFNKEELEAVKNYIKTNNKEFESGTKSAGWHARAVKRNEQLPESVQEPLIQKASKALMKNEVFLSAARPKRFVKLMVSRYMPGMEYGWHVDNALMDGIRTDLSFTLFLNDPQSYEGGELFVDSHEGSSEYKLSPGSCVLYPTTMLHRVAPVTSGERLAIVGWIRSFIRNEDEREMLFDLDQAIVQTRSQHVSRDTIDLLLKVKMNLLRKYAED
jgi:PKHD-type hydroxylase